MPSRLSIVLLAAAVALSLPVGVASAHDSRFPSRIEIRAADAQGSQVLLAGKIRADHRECRAGRTVVLLVRFEEDGPRAVLDVDQSSDNGAWAVRGNFDDTSDQKVKVLKEDLREGSNHDHVCEADSTPVVL